MLIENFKIALHHLLSNKTRTIYISLISCILGFLSLFLLIMDISVRVNGDKLSEDMYYNKISNVENENNSILCNFYAESKYLNQIEYIEKKDVLTISDYINENDKYVDNYSIYLSFYDGLFEILHDNNDSNNKMYNSGIQCYDIKKCINDNKIVLKNNNSPSDKLYLYVSEKYADKYNLKVSDKLKFQSVDKENIFEFEIVDIYSDFYDNYADVLFDVNALNDNIRFGVSSVSIKINKNNDVKDTIRFNKDLIDNYKSLNNKYYYGCDNYNMYLKIQVYTNIFFYLVLIFIVIVALLSILLISNSILVLLDLNKDKMGILKSLGLKNKDSLFIIIFEILATTILGFIVSIIFIYSFSYFIGIINTNIFKVLYSFIDSNTLLNFNIQLYNQFYILVVFVVIILLFLILFSYKNIRYIMKKSPILLLRRDE